MNLEARFQDAIQSFWTARTAQRDKQQVQGKIDVGTRGAVTGGTQMEPMAILVSDILVEAGIQQEAIKTRTVLELPGYYRPEKKWDLIVVADKQLVAAVEFKSQIGPSFGNNFNNRVEEAIGSASDIWTAYREGRFGNAPAPFLGYFFLLEDCPKVKKPVSSKEPYFTVDPAFNGASYSKRYEILCRRLVLERLYSASCLILATNELHTKITHPAADLSLKRFVAAVQGHVKTIVGS